MAVTARPERATVFIPPVRAQRAGMPRRPLAPVAAVPLGAVGQTARLVGAAMALSIQALMPRTVLAAVVRALVVLGFRPMRQTSLALVVRLALMVVAAVVAVRA